MSVASQHVPREKPISPWIVLPTICGLGGLFWYGLYRLMRWALS